jgi:hypothetical protein
MRRPPNRMICKYGPNCGEAAAPLNRHAGRRSHRRILRRLVGVLLNEVLLDVDHRGKALGRLARHLEVQHLGVFVKTAPSNPRQPFLYQRAVRAHPAQNLLRAARHANRATASAIAAVSFDHTAFNAVVGQQRGQCQAHGAATGNQDWNVIRLGSRISGHGCQPQDKADKSFTKIGMSFHNPLRFLLARVIHCGWYK